MSETVTFSIENHVARLTLNNPEKHNALGRKELDALRSAVAEVAASDSVRVLVLTGEGDKTFCAGASLQELNAGEIRGDDYQDMTDAIKPVCGAFAPLPLYGMPSMVSSSQFRSVLKASTVSATGGLAMLMVQLS